MKKAFGYIAITLTLSACIATSPTGRKQLLLLPESQLEQMGATAFAQMKQERPVTQNNSQDAYVRCVASAVTRELDPQDQRQWEVQVFEDGSANAFALPGGKIGVHTGLLKVATNQSQLASVLGHEVGHVLAQHGNERMSIQQATQTGTQLLQVLAGEPTAQKQQLFGLLGLGTQVGVSLPFSRKHETEADYIGLKLMAKAGFDPRQSVNLWENMARASGGKQPMEFLSTHPSNQTRINDLNAHMQEALQIYNQAKAQGKNPRCG